MTAFREIEVGTRATLEHTITASEVETFARLTGDFNPLHVDPEYAAHSSFGKPVVHGMLSASFLSTFIGMILPGRGALWTNQKLEFTAPVFVGDTLRIEGVVRQKSVSISAMVLDLTVTNQKGQTVLRSESTVRLTENGGASLGDSEKMQTEVKAQRIENTRTVWVTGATGGIGSAIVRDLARQGFQMIIGYASNTDQAQCLVEECKGLGVRAMRLQQGGDLIGIRKELGEITDFVHCASLPPITKPFEQSEWQDFQSHWDVQIRQAYESIQLLLPSMTASHSGTLTLIGSIYADGVPPTQLAPYVVAKAALSAFARSLAVELGPKGIRVNVVAPGMTHTPMISAVPEKAKLLAKMQTPLRRLADPNDISSVVSFLLSPSAKHITGEVLRVCGGAVMV